MKKLFATAAVAVLLFTSCNKSNGDELRYITKENIIGSYKMIAMEIVSGGQAADGLAVTDACKKDDLYIFKPGDVFEYADAGATCSANGSFTRSWGLAADSITINGMGAKVTELTDTTLRVSTTTSALGVPVTVSTMFARN